MKSGKARKSCRGVSKIKFLPAAGPAMVCVLFFINPVLQAAYSPPSMGLDSWFIREGGTWHQFQLCGPYPWDLDKTWPALNQVRAPLPAVEQGIWHSTSKDLICWRDEGLVLTVGEPGRWDDGKIYTGNICKHKGRFYLFYTGIREHPKPDEPVSLIGVAVSDDLVNWTKHPDNPVLVPDPRYYEPLGNWRDCNFYYDGKSENWYAVITATEQGDGPVAPRACIGLAKSRDLIHWQCLPRLAVSDRYRLGMENPFLFRHKQTWYLGHSMYSRFFSQDWLSRHPEVRPEGGVHYVTAADMFGPYSVPENDGLGCQPDPPPYAVQIIEHDRQRLFMHRGPDRWATALPKKIEFLPSKQMRIVYWQGTEKARGASLMQQTSSNVTVDAQSRPSVVVGKPGLDCFFSAVVQCEETGCAGLSLGDTFLVVVDCNAGVVYQADSADRKPRPDRTAKVSAGGRLKIRLVADGSVVDVYANDIWLFAGSRRRPTVDRAELTAIKGRAAITDIRLDRLETGNIKYKYGFNY